MRKNTQNTTKQTATKQTAEQTAKVTVNYKSDKSLELTDEQLALIPSDVLATYSIMKWGCNPNMITLYYDGKQVIEIMSGKTKRISTKPQFASDDYETRNSGYGLDKTKKLDKEADAETVKAEVKKLSTEVIKAIETAKAEKAKIEAEKQAKAEAKRKAKEAKQAEAEKQKQSKAKKQTASKQKQTEKKAEAKKQTVTAEQKAILAEARKQRAQKKAEAEQK